MVARNGVINRLVTAPTQAVANLLLAGRNALVRLLDPNNRDLDRECGYPIEFSLEQYRYLYRRYGLARRAVNVYPDECWSVPPSLQESEDGEDDTDFETDWKLLFQNPHTHPWHYLHRLDRLCGVGRYGAMLLGFDDLGPNDDLSKPVAGFTGRGRPSTKKRNLLFLRTFDEWGAQILELDNDSSSEHYQQPLLYRLRLSDPTMLTPGNMMPVPAQFVDTTVHWTRVIHAADNCESAEIAGVPRLEPIGNNVLDMRKILGGSAEMFWRGAFPGYAFETLPELASEAEVDTESVEQQMEAYAAGLKRYIALTGMTVKPLLPQMADPTAHMTQQIGVICAAIAVPFPVFMGFQQGHLAGTQDLSNWNRRLSFRQTDLLHPRMILPLAQRLMDCGVCRPNKRPLQTVWDDLNTLSAKDRADLALKTAQSLLQYVTSGAEKVMTPRDFFITVLRMSPKGADAMVKAALANKLMVTREIWKQPPNPTAQGATGETSPNTKGRASRNAQG